MGFVIASSYEKRVYNLRQLMAFIQMLESEIQFARTTLPQIIAAQAPRFPGEIGKFLVILSSNLKAGTGESFSVIWEHGVASLAQNGLPISVLQDLRSCGQTLGTSDVNEQEKHLKQLLQRLDQALKAAEGEREKHTRLWQYLGISTGLLIVLLLL